MSSLCRRSAVIFFLLSSVSFGRVLRVCADPNNLPFSNEAQQGFENRLAELVARDLDATLEYTWWSERKSFVKNSLNSDRCDVIMGIASGVDSVLTTAPYYRSTYVFVSRADRKLNVSSLADERLAKWKIGIHIVDDDYAPPAHALAGRGLGANLVGFSLFGAYGEANPPARIIDAVVNRSVDVAIVWGPTAGYFAARARDALEVTPVRPPMWMGIPFTYDISMAVRMNDEKLKGELNGVLQHECAAVRSLLAQYKVPQLTEDQPACDSLPQSPVSSR